MTDLIHFIFKKLFLLLAFSLPGLLLPIDIAHSAQEVKIIHNDSESRDAREDRLRNEKEKAEKQKREEVERNRTFGTSNKEKETPEQKQKRLKEESETIFGIKEKQKETEEQKQKRLQEESQTIFGTKEKPQEEDVLQDRKGGAKLNTPTEDLCNFARGVGASKHTLQKMLPAQVLTSWYFRHDKFANMVTGQAYDLRPYGDMSSYDGPPASWTDNCMVRTARTKLIKSNVPIPAIYSYKITIKKLNPLTGQFEAYKTLSSGANLTFENGTYQATADLVKQLAGHFAQGPIHATFAVKDPKLNRKGKKGIAEILIEGPAPGTAFTIFPPQTPCKVYVFKAMVREGTIEFESGGTIKIGNEVKRAFNFANWEVSKDGQVVQAQENAGSLSFDAKARGDGNYILKASIPPNLQAQGVQNFQVRSSSYTVASKGCGGGIAPAPLKKAKKMPPPIKVLEPEQQVPPKGPQILVDLPHEKGQAFIHPPVEVPVDLSDCVEIRRQFNHREKIVADNPRCDKPVALMKNLYRWAEEYNTSYDVLLKKYGDLWETLAGKDSDLAKHANTFDLLMAEYNKIRNEADAANVLASNEDLFQEQIKLQEIMQSEHREPPTIANGGLPAGLFIDYKNVGDKIKTLRDQAKAIYPKYVKAREEVLKDYEFFAKNKPQEKIQKGLQEGSAPLLEAQKNHNAIKEDLSKLFYSGVFEHCLGSAVKAGGYLDQDAQYNLPGMAVVLPDPPENLAVKIPEPPPPVEELMLNFKRDLGAQQQRDRVLNQSLKTIENKALVAKWVERGLVVANLLGAKDEYTQQNISEFMRDLPVDTVRTIEKLTGFSPESWKLYIQMLEKTDPVLAKKLKVEKKDIMSFLQLQAGVKQMAYEMTVGFIAHIPGDIEKIYKAHQQDFLVQHGIGEEIGMGGIEKRIEATKNMSYDQAMKAFGGIGKDIKTRDEGIDAVINEAFVVLPMVVPLIGHLSKAVGQLFNVGGKTLTGAKVLETVRKAQGGANVTLEQMAQIAQRARTSGLTKVAGEIEQTIKQTVLAEEKARLVRVALKGPIDDAIKNFEIKNGRAPSGPEMRAIKREFEVKGVDAAQLNPAEQEAFNKLAKDALFQKQHPSLSKKVVADIKKKLGIGETFSSDQQLNAFTRAYEEAQLKQAGAVQLSQKEILAFKEQVFANQAVQKLQTLVPKTEGLVKTPKKGAAAARKQELQQEADAVRREEGKFREDVLTEQLRGLKKDKLTPEQQAELKVFEERVGELNKEQFEVNKRELDAIDAELKTPRKEGPLAEQLRQKIAAEDARIAENRARNKLIMEQDIPKVVRENEALARNLTPEELFGKGDPQAIEAALKGTFGEEFPEDAIKQWAKKFSEENPEIISPTEGAAGIEEKVLTEQLRGLKKDKLTPEQQAELKVFEERVGELNKEQFEVNKRELDAIDAEQRRQLEQTVGNFAGTGKLDEALLDAEKALGRSLTNPEKIKLASRVLKGDENFKVFNEKVDKAFGRSFSDKARDKIREDLVQFQLEAKSIERAAESAKGTPLDVEMVSREPVGSAAELQAKIDAALELKKQLILTPGSDMSKVKQLNKEIEALEQALRDKQTPLQPSKGKTEPVKFEALPKLNQNVQPVRVEVPQAPQVQQSLISPDKVKKAPPKLIEQPKAKPVQTVDDRIKKLDQDYSRLAEQTDSQELHRILQEEYGLRAGTPEEKAVFEYFFFEHSGVNKALGENKLQSILKQGSKDKDLKELNQLLDENRATIQADTQVAPQPTIKEKPETLKAARKRAEKEAQQLLKSLEQQAKQNKEFTKEAAKILSDLKKATADQGTIAKNITQAENKLKTLFEKRLRAESEGVSDPSKLAELRERVAVGLGGEISPTGEFILARVEQDTIARLIAEQSLKRGEGFVGAVRRIEEAMPESLTLEQRVLAIDPTLAEISDGKLLAERIKRFGLQKQDSENLINTFLEKKGATNQLPGDRQTIFRLKRDEAKTIIDKILNGEELTPEQKLKLPHEGKRPGGTEPAEFTDKPNVGEDIEGFKTPQQQPLETPQERSARQKELNQQIENIKKRQADAKLEAERESLQAELNKLIEEDHNQRLGRTEALSEFKELEASFDAELSRRLGLLENPTPEQITKIKNEIAKDMFLELTPEGKIKLPELKKLENKGPGERQTLQKVNRGLTKIEEDAAKMEERVDAAIKEAVERQERLDKLQKDFDAKKKQASEVTDKRNQKIEPSSKHPTLIEEVPPPVEPEFTIAFGELNVGKVLGDAPPLQRSPEAITIAKEVENLTLDANQQLLKKGVLEEGLRLSGGSTTTVRAGTVTVDGKTIEVVVRDLVQPTDEGGVALANRARVENAAYKFQFDSGPPASAIKGEKWIQERAGGDDLQTFLNKNPKALEDPLFKKQVREALAERYLLGNPDHNPANLFVIQKDGKYMVQNIDLAGAFGETTPLMVSDNFGKGFNSILTEMSGQKIPSDFLNKLEKLLEGARQGRITPENTGLTPEEIKRFIQRTELLVKEGTFPKVLEKGDRLPE